VADLRAVSYLRRHLQKLLEAIAIGVPVRVISSGLFSTTLEWGYGTSKRFGLIHVDFRTLQRTPKTSSDWYQQVIKDNAAE
jgi:beta-glucosidase